MQAQVFAALQQGNTVLSQLNSETSIEDVEQLMEDTREAVDYQNQVAKLMGSEISEEDEADIEATIAGWEEESVAEAVNKLPDAPVKVPAATESPEVTPAVSSKPATRAQAKEVVLA